ncbi:hypothetical protein ABKA04_002077 [Annulohypoxylon sp. FPYF3050]
MPNLLKRPGNEISGYNALIDNAQFRYLMTDRDVWDNVIYFDIVRKNLSLKNMGPIAGVMAEEWDLAFLLSWGQSKDGVSVNAWESMVFAHAVLDIHCSQCGDDVRGTLETECRRVSAEHCGLSSKEAIHAHNIDSAVRESMRLNNVSIYLLPFDVISGGAVEHHRWI